MVVYQYRQIMQPAIDTALDIEQIRRDFPILHQQVNGRPLVYFDNAATNQKPLPVIDALTRYYEGYNANIHRGIHHLAEQATVAFEASRRAVQEFLNASTGRKSSLRMVLRMAST